MLSAWWRDEVDGPEKGGMGWILIADDAVDVEGAAFRCGDADEAGCCFDGDLGALCWPLRFRPPRSLSKA